jgi:hypothetical protein
MESPAEEGVFAEATADDASRNRQVRSNILLKNLWQEEA